MWSSAKELVVGLASKQISKILAFKFGSCLRTVLAHIWAQSDLIFLLLKPAPFYGVSLAGVSLHCLQNPRLAKSGLKIQESIEKKNWPNFGANSSLGDKLGIWWIWSATISLITRAHYYCGDSLVNVTRRQNYCENKREANWPNCAAGAIMAKARGLSDRWRNDRLKMLVVKNFLKI